MQYDKIVQIKPSIFLEGEKPRLFDEWQMYPVVWDSIRMDVDHTGLNGQYIRVQQDQQKIAWRTAARAKSLNY